MPFLMLAYLIASLDRVNVGFAALQMNSDLGLTAAQFGLGSGLFFIAYCICAVPCSALVQRIGTRRGLGFIMLAWGLASAFTGLVTDAASFAIVRVALGAAEAAFFPTVISYLKEWLPGRHRGRLLAIMMLGLPLASVVGSPISGALLTLDGAFGIRGWRWLFFLEGAPAALLGITVGLWLPKSISAVTWLDQPQKLWLNAEIMQDHPASLQTSTTSMWQHLLSSHVLALTFINIGAIGVTNGLAIWQPQMIARFGLSPLSTGLVNAIPFSCGCAALYAWAWHSDRAQERRLHTALPLFAGALALVMTMVTQTLSLTLIVLCIAVSASSMIKGPFWALATETTKSERAPLVFAQVTSLTNIGAFLGTYGIGVVKDATGSFGLAMLPLIAVTLGAALTALMVSKQQSLHRLA